MVTVVWIRRSYQRRRVVNLGKSNGETGSLLAAGVERTATDAYITVVVGRYLKIVARTLIGADRGAFDTCRCAVIDLGTRDGERATLSRNRSGIGSGHRQGQCHRR